MPGRNLSLRGTRSPMKDGSQRVKLPWRAFCIKIPVNPNRSQGLAPGVLFYQRFCHFADNAWQFLAPVLPGARARPAGARRAPGQQSPAGALPSPSWPCTRDHPPGFILRAQAPFNSAFKRLRPMLSSLPCCNMGLLLWPNLHTKYFPI